MQSVTKGRLWYQEYLKSDHWEKTKKKVLRKKPYICSMIWCGKYRNLQFHHIDYSHLETVREVDDIYIVCGTHHYLCHFTLFGKVPLRRRDLMKRYRYLYISTWRRFRPSWFFQWMYDTYRIR